MPKGKLLQISLHPIYLFYTNLERVWRRHTILMMQEPNEYGATVVLQTDCKSTFISMMSINRIMADYSLLSVYSAD